MICDLLESEINAGLQTCPFDILRVWLGDELNGLDAVAEIGPDDPAWSDDVAPIGCRRPRSGSIRRATTLSGANRPRRGLSVIFPNSLFYGSRYDDEPDRRPHRPPLPAASLGILQSIHHHRRHPARRRLVGRVEAHQQLKIILADHVDSLTSWVRLRKLPSLRYEISREMRALDAAHVVNYVVSWPSFTARPAASSASQSASVSSPWKRTSPILRSSQVSISNTAIECRFTGCKARAPAEALRAAAPAGSPAPSANCNSRTLQSLTLGPNGYPEQPMSTHDEKVRETLHDTLTRANVDTRNLAIEVVDSRLIVKGTVPPPLISKSR